MNVSMMALWDQSGMFARGVIVVLAIMSVYSLTIAVTKLIQIKRSTKASRKLAPALSKAIMEDKLDVAIQLAEKDKVGHIARVLGGALGEMKPLISDKATITAADINSSERAIERQMLILLSEFRRGLGVLGTVGSTAPFVGLLGTTMGIVNAFTGMSAGASGGLAGISAGIAEALITTAFGLLVAIPAVWFYNYFTTKIDNLSVEMTYASKELIDQLIKNVGASQGRSIFTKEFQAQKAVTGSGHLHG